MFMEVSALTLSGVLAEQTVSISEFRKSPARYVQDGPVAVLSNVRPVGYLLSPELFEHLSFALARSQDAVELKANLKLSESSRNDPGKLEAVRSNGPFQPRLKLVLNHSQGIQDE